MNPVRKLKNMMIIYETVSKYCKKSYVDKMFNLIF